MKEAIKLDKWDSQIVLLSKFWFKKELQELNKTNVDALKALWADRCYLEVKYIELGHLISHLVEMLEKLSLLNSREVTSMLLEAIYYRSDFNRYGFKRTEEVTREEDVINSLLSRISTVDVKDDERDLIILEEKYTSFLDVYKEEK